MLFGAGYRNEDLVFARPDGSRIDPDVVSQAFQRLVARTDLPLIRFRDLRHSHASLALRSGEHPKVVQERLGHASAQTTLDTYSQVEPGLHGEAASRIAALVDGDAAISPLSGAARRT